MAIAFVFALVFAVAVVAAVADAFVVAVVRSCHGEAETAIVCEAN
jgi:hypothetical protein